jgi:hypothetical protein
VNEAERDLLIERLALDRETLERTAHRTHQWGEAIARPLTDETHEVEAGRAPAPEAVREAASLFAIAGSYRMLLDPALAKGSLLPAAVYFAADRSTFSYPLAICAGESALALESLQDLPAALPAQNRSHALLALSWLDVTDGGRRSQGSSPLARELLYRHLDGARAVTEARVGRMQIPLGAVAEVADAAALTAHGEGDPARLSRALHDALMRVHDVTAAAKSDRYHWQRLMSSVLPVEPEAVVLAGVAMAAAARAGYSEELVGRIDLPEIALVPMALGRELAEEAL